MGVVCRSRQVASGTKYLNVSSEMVVSPSVKVAVPVSGLVWITIVMSGMGVRCLVLNADFARRAISASAAARSSDRGG